MGAPFPLTPRPGGGPQCVSPAKGLCGCCHSRKGVLGCRCWTAGGFCFRRTGLPTSLEGDVGILKQEISRRCLLCVFPTMLLCSKGRAGCISPHLFPSASDDTLPLSPNASQPRGHWGLQILLAQRHTSYAFPRCQELGWVRPGHLLQQSGPCLCLPSLLPSEWRKGTSFHQQLTRWGDQFSGSILQVKKTEAQTGFHLAA